MNDPLLFDFREYRHLVGRTIHDLGGHKGLADDLGPLGDRIEERAEQMRLRAEALETALRELWRWAVRTGPFIEAVILLAEDKGPGLNLLTDVPALREKVIAALGIEDAALTSEATDG